MTEPCNRFGMASILALIMMLDLCWIPLLTESAIGVNWGTVSFRKLKPSTVVDLLKDNKITKVKLFEAEADVLKALMGSGIQVMVGIPNEMLSLLSSSPAASDLWLRQNISAYTGKGGADIRLVTSNFVCTLSLYYSCIFLFGPLSKPTTTISLVSIHLFILVSILKTSFSTNSPSRITSFLSWVPIPTFLCNFLYVSKKSK